ncbi:MAG: hypothetical protein II899_10410 [Bacteroidales bacterium]|nr:hypothetical protein [Bacteroidales bacterium]MCR4858110.1 hypothetical protein [Bacteroidales bacterium]
MSDDIMPLLKELVADVKQSDDYPLLKAGIVHYLMKTSLSARLCCKEIVFLKIARCRKEKHAV